MSLFKKDRDPTLGNKFLDPNRDIDESDGDPEKRLRHSGYSAAYHSFFEGYAERQVIDGKGKKRIERYYTGDIHRHKLTDNQWIGLKALYLFLYILAAVSFVAIASQPVDGNFTWYVQAAEALGIMSLFALLYIVICYLTSSRDLTAHSYHQTTVYFKTLTMIATVCTALPLFLQILHFILDRGALNLAAEIKITAFMPLPPLMLFAMWFIEAKKIKYDKITGKDAPYDAVNL